MFFSHLKNAEIKVVFLTKTISRCFLSHQWVFDFLVTMVTVAYAAQRKLTAFLLLDGSKQREEVACPSSKQCN